MSRERAVEAAGGCGWPFSEAIKWPRCSRGLIFSSFPVKSINCGNVAGRGGRQCQLNF